MPAARRNVIAIDSAPASSRAARRRSRAIHTLARKTLPFLVAAIVGTLAGALMAGAVLFVSYAAPVGGAGRDPPAELHALPAHKQILR